MKKAATHINNTVDLAVFAGQSNMSGRGDASLAAVCNVNAGFEYKAVSNPDVLTAVTEPFGLGEDKEGAISDLKPDGVTKRSGSMVSAAVDEYYNQTGRQLVAVSASIGGSRASEWLNNYITDAVERLDAAKAFLAENGIAVGRTFVVWCQGESDADDKLSADAYKANTGNIFKVFKAHGAQKCFIVQIGHYNYIDYSVTAAGLTGKEWDEYYGIIRGAQAELCESDDDFILAGSFEPYIGDMKDQYHYNQKAYNEVGKTVGENIGKYYKNTKGAQK
ncbi:MAG: sialate O-acetylesterase [Oscillospiraceae bacterium]|nr:sialate O-acetylesterase [Oscillospiraceae bacterium]